MYLNINFKNGSNPYLAIGLTESSFKHKFDEWSINYNLTKIHESDLGYSYLAEEKVKDNQNNSYKGYVTDYIKRNYGNDKEMIDWYTDDNYLHKNELIYAIESNIDFCDFERWIDFETHFGMTISWNSFEKIMNVLWAEADIDIADICR